jgi:hypothetical protein
MARSLGSALGAALHTVALNVAIGGSLTGSRPHPALSRLRLPPPDMAAAPPGGGPEKFASKRGLRYPRSRPRPMRKIGGMATLTVADRRASAFDVARAFRGVFKFALTGRG